MYGLIVQFWTEVKRAFPQAWGLPPEQSRLMHSAGIAAIGALMDHLMPRAAQHAAPAEFFGRTLRDIAPNCAWTRGRWPDMDRAWNQVESTAKDIRNLSDQLIRLSAICSWFTSTLTRKSSVEVDAGGDAIPV